MAVRTEPGRWERGFASIGLLLTTGAILDMARARVTETSGGDLDPAGDPVKQVLFLSVYAIAFVLFVRRCGLLSVVKFSPWVWAIVSIVVCSTLWSVDPELTFRRSMALCGTTVFGTYLGVAYSPLQLLRLIATTLLTALSLTLLAALFLPQVAITTNGASPSWNGIYQQKNMLGQYMALAAFVFALMYRQSRRVRMPNHAWLLAIAAAMTVLLLSTSKSALVATLVSFSCFPLVLFLAAARRRSPRQLIGSAAIVMAVGVTTCIAAWHYFIPITQALGRDPTLTGRTYVWQAVIDAISQRPWLGYGYSAFWGGLDSPAADVWAQTSNLMLGLRVTHAHNGMLDLLLQLGVIGAAVYFVMVFQLLGYTLREAVRPYTTATELFTVGFCLSLMVSNLVESKTLDQNSFAWVMVCALVAQRGVEADALRRRARARIRENVVRPDQRRFPTRRRPAATHPGFGDRE